MFNIDDNDDDEYFNNLANTQRQEQQEDFAKEVNKQARKSNGALVIIVAFSLMVAIDALIRDSNGEDTNGDVGGAMAISMISLVVSVMKYCHTIFIDSQFSATFEVAFGCILIIIWTAGVIHLTFQNVGAFFNLTTSGFFATWICLLMSGFYTFNIWGGLQKSAERAGRRRGCMHFKKGITPTLAVAIMLTIGLLGAAGLTLDDGTPRRVRAVMSIVFSAPTLIALLTIVCCPLSAYGDPDNFLAMITVLMGFVFFQVFFTTMSEPFALRPDQSQPFDVVGNGFFSVMGLFVTLAVLLYNSHVFILRYNAEMTSGYGVQGRYIFLSLLGMSGAVFTVASAVECQAAKGCDQNIFLSPMIGVGFFTAFTAPFVFFICRENKDPGDILLMNPDEEIDYFANNYEKFEFVIGLVYFVVWTAGAAVFTFSVDSPFQQTSTGYFFAWFCFFFATFYFNAVFPRVGLVNLRCMDWSPPNKMKPKANLGFSIILLGCIIQIVAISSECAEETGCELNSYIGYGLNGVILFLTFLLLMLTPDRLGLLAVILIYTLCAVSYVMLILTTIITGPFDEVQGNGFFAAWVTAYGAFYVINNYEWRFADL